MMSLALPVCLAFAVSIPIPSVHAQIPDPVVPEPPSFPAVATSLTAGGSFVDAPSGRFLTSLSSPPTGVTLRLEGAGLTGGERVAVVHGTDCLGLATDDATHVARLDEDDPLREVQMPAVFARQGVSLTGDGPLSLCHMTTLSGGAWSFLGPALPVRGVVVTSVSPSSLTARPAGGATTTATRLTLGGIGLMASDAVMLHAIDGSVSRAGAEALLGSSSLSVASAGRSSCGGLSPGSAAASARVILANQTTIDAGALLVDVNVPDAAAIGLADGQVITYAVCASPSSGTPYVDTTMRVTVQAATGATVAAVFPRWVQVSDGADAVPSGTVLRAYLTRRHVDPKDTFGLVAAAEACSTAGTWHALDAASLRPAQGSSARDPVASATFTLAADVKITGAAVTGGNPVPVKVCYRPAGYPAANAVTVTSPMAAEILLVVAADCASGTAGAGKSASLVTPSWTGLPADLELDGGGSQGIAAAPLWVSGCTLDGDSVSVGSSTGDCSAGVIQTTPVVIPAGNAPVVGSGFRLPAAVGAGAAVPLCVERSGAGPMRHGAADAHSVIAAWPVGWGATLSPGWGFAGVPTAAQLNPALFSATDNYILAPAVSLSTATTTTTTGGGSALASLSCSLGGIQSAGAADPLAVVLAAGPFTSAGATAHGCGAAGTGGCGAIEPQQSLTSLSSSASGVGLVVCGRRSPRAAWTALPLPGPFLSRSRLAISPVSLSATTRPVVVGALATDTLGATNASSTTCAGVPVAGFVAEPAPGVVTGGGGGGGTTAGNGAGLLASAPWAAHLAGTGAADGSSLSLCVSTANPLGDTTAQLYPGTDALASGTAVTWSSTGAPSISLAYPALHVGQVADGAIAVVSGTVSAGDRVSFGCVVGGAASAGAITGMVSVAAVPGSVAPSASMSVSGVGTLATFPPGMSVPVCVGATTSSLTPAASSTIRLAGLSDFSVIPSGAAPGLTLARRHLYAWETFDISVNTTAGDITDRVALVPGAQRCTDAGPTAGVTLLSPTGGVLAGLTSASGLFHGSPSVALDGPGPRRVCYRAAGGASWHDTGISIKVVMGMDAYPRRLVTGAQVDIFFGPGAGGSATAGDTVALVADPGGALVSSSDACLSVPSGEWETLDTSLRASLVAPATGQYAVCHRPVSSAAGSWAPGLVPSTTLAVMVESVPTVGTAPAVSPVTTSPGGVTFGFSTHAVTLTLTGDVTIQNGAELTVAAVPQGATAADVCTGLNSPAAVANANDGVENGADDGGAVFPENTRGRNRLIRSRANQKVLKRNRQQQQQQQQQVRQLRAGGVITATVDSLSYARALVTLNAPAPGDHALCLRYRSTTPWIATGAVLRTNSLAAGTAVVPAYAVSAAAMGGAATGSLAVLTIAGGGWVSGVHAACLVPVPVGADGAAGSTGASSVSCPTDPAKCASLNVVVAAAGTDAATVTVPATGTGAENGGAYRLCVSAGAQALAGGAGAAAPVMVDGTVNVASPRLYPLRFTTTIAAGSGTVPRSASVRGGGVGPGDQFSLVAEGSACPDKAAQAQAGVGIATLDETAQDEPGVYTVSSLGVGVAGAYDLCYVHRLAAAGSPMVKIGPAGAVTVVSASDPWTATVAPLVVAAGLTTRITIDGALGNEPGSVRVIRADGSYANATCTSQPRAIESAAAGSVVNTVPPTGGGDDGDDGGAGGSPPASVDITPGFTEAGPLAFDAHIPVEGGITLVRVCVARSGLSGTQKVFDDAGSVIRVAGVSAISPLTIPSFTESPAASSVTLTIRDVSTDVVVAPVLTVLGGCGSAGRVQHYVRSAGSSSAVARMSLPSGAYTVCIAAITADASHRRFVAISAYSASSGGEDPFTLVVRGVGTIAPRFVPTGVPTNFTVTSASFDEETAITSGDAFALVDPEKACAPGAPPTTLANVTRYAAADPAGLPIGAGTFEVTVPASADPVGDCAQRLSLVAVYSGVGYRAVVEQCNAGNKDVFMDAVASSASVSVIPCNRPLVHEVAPRTVLASSGAVQVTLRGSFLRAGDLARLGPLGEGVPCTVQGLNLTATTTSNASAGTVPPPGFAAVVRSIIDPTAVVLQGFAAPSLGGISVAAPPSVTELSVCYYHAEPSVAPTAPLANPNPLPSITLPVVGVTGLGVPGSRVVVVDPELGTSTVQADIDGSGLREPLGSDPAPVTLDVDLPLLGAFATDHEDTVTDAGSSSVSTDAVGSFSLVRIADAPGLVPNPAVLDCTDADQTTPGLRGELRIATAGGGSLPIAVATRATGTLRLDSIGATHTERTGTFALCVSHAGHASTGIAGQTRWVPHPELRVTVWDPEGFSPHVVVAGERTVVTMPRAGGLQAGEDIVVFVPVGSSSTPGATVTPAQCVAAMQAGTIPTSVVARDGAGTMSVNVTLPLGTYRPCYGRSDGAGGHTWVARAHWGPLSAGPREVTSLTPPTAPSPHLSVRLEVAGTGLATGDTAALVAISDAGAATCPDAIPAGQTAPADGTGVFYPVLVDPETRTGSFYVPPGALVTAVTGGGGGSTNNGTSPATGGRRFALCYKFSATTTTISTLYDSLTIRYSDTPFARGVHPRNVPAESPFTLTVYGRGFRDADTVALVPAGTSCVGHSGAVPVNVNGTAGNPVPGPKGFTPWQAAVTSALSVGPLAAGDYTLCYTHGSSVSSVASAVRVGATCAPFATMSGALPVAGNSSTGGAAEVCPTYTPYRCGDCTCQSAPCTADGALSGSFDSPGLPGACEPDLAGYVACRSTGTCAPSISECPEPDLPALSSSSAVGQTSTVCAPGWHKCPGEDACSPNGLSACSPVSRCPTGWHRCHDGSCAQGGSCDPENVHVAPSCGPGVTACGAGVCPLLGASVADGARCPPLNGCPPDIPWRCADCTCAQTTEACEIRNREAVLVWNSPCAGTAPYRCRDGSCAAQPSSCSCSAYDIQLVPGTRVSDPPIPRGTAVLSRSGQPARRFYARQLPPQSAPLSAVVSGAGSVTSSSSSSSSSSAVEIFISRGSLNVTSTQTRCELRFAGAPDSSILGLDAGPYQRVIAPAVSVTVGDPARPGECDLGDPGTVVGYDARVTFASSDVRVSTVAEADQLKCHLVPANGVASLATVVPEVLGTVPSCRISGRFVGTVAITYGVPPTVPTPKPSPTPEPTSTIIDPPASATPTAPPTRSAAAGGHRPMWMLAFAAIALVIV